MSDAKVALSARDQVDFRFNGGGIDIRSTITRKNFEAWIADDIARLGATIDKVLGEAGITARRGGEGVPDRRDLLRARRPAVVRRAVRQRTVDLGATSSSRSPTASP